MRSIFTASLLVLTASLVWAEESLNVPRPVPSTRPEMKKLLEDMKGRKPRIPLPELTEEEKAKQAEQGGRGGGGYEGRVRSLYGGGSQGDNRPRTPNTTGTGNPADGNRGQRTGGGGQFGGGNDPNNTLDYKFKVMLFWIVSRTNNCQYCLGHQEQKLAGAGMEEDRIAALDCDWGSFSPAEQAAFAFARKITYEPHRFNDADIASLKKHYTDMQILEMLLSVAGNNSINRWKEGVGVPQSKSGGNFFRSETPPPAGRVLPIETFETPTSEQYQKVITKVAPLQIDEATQAPTKLAVCNRPKLESRAEVDKALDACSKRTSRLPLVDEATARKLLPEDWAKGPLPQWVRLLANFPQEGKNRIISLRSSEEKGDLTPLMKAQVAWIIARQDRAWYATGLAQKRLMELGWSKDKIDTLDGSWEEFTPAEKSLFNVARKLAATPVVLTDKDVEEALKASGPKEVVQVIIYVTNRASFDRITEAAGLQLEQ